MCNTNVTQEWKSLIVTYRACLALKTYTMSALLAKSEWGILFKSQVYIRSRCLAAHDLCLETQGGSGHNTPSPEGQD